MKVSAVGFLFRESVKKGKLKGDNYSYIIHKIRPDGNYARKRIVSSPQFQTSEFITVTPRTTVKSIAASIRNFADKRSRSKFSAAAIKDGSNETYIHSIFSDKLFGVRTKSADGVNKYRIIGRDKAQKLIEKKLLA